MEIVTHFLSPLPSHPLKLLVQLLAREDQRRGAAVGTVMGVVDQVTLLQQRGDLLRREPVARLDRRLAGDRVQQIVQQVAAVGLLPVRRESAPTAPATPRPGSCWPAWPDSRPPSSVLPPNGSIFTPNSASRSRFSKRGGRLGRAEIDRLGHQQVLRFDRAGRHALPQLLVQDPLVQGVLVDDRHALVGLGDEVAVVDLQRRWAHAAMRGDGR